MNKRSKTIINYRKSDVIKFKDVDIFGFAENEVSLAVSVLIVRSGKMIGEKNYNIINILFKYKK